MTKNGTADVDADNQASKSDLGRGTYTVEVTSADGSTTTTVTIVVNVAAASDGTLQVKSAYSAMMKIDSTNLKILDTYEDGGITVGDLYSCLEKSDANDVNDTITITSPFGGRCG